MRLSVLLLYLLNLCLPFFCFLLLIFFYGMSFCLLFFLFLLYLVFNSSTSHLLLHCFFFFLLLFFYHKLLLYELLLCKVFWSAFSPLIDRFRMKLIESHFVKLNLRQVFCVTICTWDKSSQANWRTVDIL